MDKGQQEFLNQVMNFLVMRPGRPVMLLVHGERCLEILSNNEDLIHKRGMLETAIDVLNDLRQINDEQMREAQSKAEATAVLIKGPEGKAN